MHEQVVKDYQEQINKYENIIVNNDHEAKNLSEETQMYKQAKIEQGRTIERLERTITGMDATNCDLRAQNKHMQNKIIRMEKIIYGQTHSNSKQRQSSNSPQPMHTPIANVSKVTFSKALKSRKGSETKIEKSGYSSAKKITIVSSSSRSRKTPKEMPVCTSCKNQTSTSSLRNFNPFKHDMQR